jgi:alkanesulfonate monooxygenase SsuD/methylene tetrahydromethanopterin reductase-like flavin-dependent oxidoreductase (luciferase family)
VADAGRAEELGYDFVSMNDHLHGTSPTFETWTLLTWIAARTSRIRVAPRVLAVPYRNPAVVAKMAESLQRFSKGRLILGMGGGASDGEFRAFGVGAPSPRDKVDGMEEAIRIARGLWAERGFTFTGRRYRTEAADLEPKPEAPIPIWLGTYGDRALEVTGRLADGWIPTYELAPTERVVAMRDRVLAAAEGAGRSADELTCVYNLDLRVEDPGEGDAGVGDDPGVIVGPAEALIDRLVGFARLGFTAMNFCPAGPGIGEQVERLAREVVPAVREAT